METRVAKAAAAVPAPVDADEQLAHEQLAQWQAQVAEYSSNFYAERFGRRPSDYRALKK